MPIYEYVCADCGKKFDYLARTLADAPADCPACGSKQITKAFSAFQTRTAGAGEGCAHAAGCPHAHGPGCGCCH